MTEKYSYEESLIESKKYFNGDELAAKVFIDKYALRDDQGNILENTPEKSHRRLAKEFARIEKKYKNSMSEEEIFSLFDKFKWIIPQGSPMSAIGNENKIQSASNCFVIPSPVDSYGGILFTDQQQAQIMKRRGGVGFDISAIRPKGIATTNAAGTTDGISVFMERFSNTCREVAQNGRRGALMLTISCKHPEIETFISIKKNLKKVTGANISIRVTDDFMKAVKNDSDFNLQWPIDSKTPKIVKTVKAKDIWNQIIEAAWTSAEPGVLFWDNVINNGPADIYKEFGYESVSTNPCGEITLSPYDSCRLMVVNLLSFVKNPFTEKAKFDFVYFAEIVQKAQRLMDDMIDIEIEQIDKILNKIKADPEDKNIKAIELDLWNNIRKTCENGRRTGLGITALGDTIAALNMRYGSEESIVKTEKIYKTLAINSEKSSCILAKERGTFPIFNKALEKGHVFIERLLNADEELKELYNKYGRRNISTTTTAPVGSLSQLARTTSGIEPAFLVSYKRKKKINPTDTNVKVDYVDAMGDKWQEFIVYHPGFQNWMDVTGKTKLEDSPYYKSMSNDVDWAASVDIQAVAQKWISHSISKTCNLPNSATKELVSEIYMKAWEKGCKGFTIYRDGCRDGVLTAVDTVKKETVNDSSQINEVRMTDKIIKVHAPKRPKVLKSDVYHIKVKGQEYFVIVGLWKDGTPYEVFAGKNGHISKDVKKGEVIKNNRGHYIFKFDNDKTIDNISKYISEDQEGITRNVSLAMRHGIDVSFIVHQMEKTNGTLDSFSKAISRALKKYIQNGTAVYGEQCSNCGGKLVRIEGCMSCLECQTSKCG